MRFRSAISISSLLAGLLMQATVASAAQRQCVLVEGFTNASCPWCAVYNPGVRSVMTAMTRDTCVKVSYHVWWPGSNDPMYLWNTSEITARTNYYGVGGVPDLFVDYVQPVDISSTESIRGAVRARYATPSPCTMAVSAVPSGSTAFHFAASVRAEQDMSGANYRLYVVLTNDLITYGSPPGNNGETEFPDVFRDFYPNGNPGQSFSIAAGETYDLDGLLSRDASWDLANCTVVAFVQNSTTKEILQATWARVIANPGTITLTSPNGSELWYAGEQHNLTWTSTNLTENVRIQIQRNFPANAWQTIVVTAPNTGSYAWTVNEPGATAARVKISGVVQTVTADTSNANFNIGGVTVTSPNGGDLLLVGDAANITWTSPNMTENVRIEVNRTYPGTTWETLAASAPNTGSYSWTVTSPATTTARIRISGVTHTAVKDSSDASFTIAARTATVTAPNGGEVWTVPNVNTISWSWQYVTGMFNIELNRNYPSGPWEMLASGVTPSGTYSWQVTSPASTHARIRITSMSYPIATDVSDGDFTIVVPNLAPILKHDALCDFAPGTGQVVAIARDPSLVLSVASVKMFYRIHGQVQFDSLTLNPTGHTDEYAASLAFLNRGSYDYYLRVLDDGGLSAAVPANAPGTLYRFAVYPLCGPGISYDDGSAEYYNWVVADNGIGFQWAVKFGPMTTPYVLCGAQFASSRMLPDTLHTPVYVAVYAANGPGGMPGTLLCSKIAGSVGNVIGGLPQGTNWAQVSFDDSLGIPLKLDYQEFYVAVGNLKAGEYESIGRDTDGPRNHHSYFFDACMNNWYSEDDTTNSTNAHPGNLLIRALTSPFSLTLVRDNDDLVLHWADLGAVSYHVYSSASEQGPFDTLEGTTATNSFRITNGANNSTARRFYQVYMSNP